VLELADQIARHPFRPGHHQNLDTAGRTVENLLLQEYLLSYWPDHASREIRISEIIKV